MKHVDFIIAGAGASGLSLLHRMMNHPFFASSSILVIDQSLKPNTEKTWCFWSKEQDPYGYGSMLEHSWTSLRIGSPSVQKQEEIAPYTYHCLRSETFSKTILKQAHEASNITLLEATIESFDQEGQQAVVNTSRGVYSAPWCFQSVIAKKVVDPNNHNQNELNQNENRKKTSDIALVQHFTGWEIKTKDPVFDPSAAVLMDFDTPQGNGLTFMYTLPFSPTTTLIECTLFSKTRMDESFYEQSIATYIQNEYDLSKGQYTITRKESGNIPMETTHYASKLNDRTLCMGQWAGHTKPSTGYTFSRIQTQVDQVITQLVARTSPKPAGQSPTRFRIYDLMLLSILDHESSKGLPIFDTLFRRNSIHDILRFLDESSHLGQELWIFSRLPYGPFFRSMARHPMKILQGGS
ncbi:MAG: lycopene cyclase family protein [Balneolaceae bacterium]|nr:lycopene cyclase family protein [Balneolaceae bacterium]MDR9446116.1 lycopene cyclase family protein [Balneolaceae bacterium]